uniref:Uncharacterized protein n=1 Tax=viral metagenome TaxID=1070528 RepID=A0A6M3LCQ6_9ZZZZ
MFLVIGALSVGAEEIIVWDYIKGDYVILECKPCCSNPPIIIIDPKRYYHAWPPPAPPKGEWLEIAPIAPPQSGVTGKEKP